MAKDTIDEPALGRPAIGTRIMVIGTAAAAAIILILNYGYLSSAESASVNVTESVKTNFSTQQKLEHAASYSAKRQKDIHSPATRNIGIQPPQEGTVLYLPPNRETQQTIQ